MGEVERVGGLEWVMGGLTSSWSVSSSPSESMVARQSNWLERGMDVAGCAVGGGGLRRVLRWTRWNSRSAAEVQKSEMRVSADWGVRRELVRVSCRETMALAAGRSVWLRLV